MSPSNLPPSTPPVEKIHQPIQSLRVSFSDWSFARPGCFLENGGMEKPFEELDYQSTPLGELSLRRRKIPMLDNEIVYEVILNQEFLMSSLFHEAEDALADQALALLKNPGTDVVVGGLGLGYTAAASLKHDTVASLAVVEFLHPVIDWHQRGLLPVQPQPDKDPRTTLVHADFFELAASGNGFLPGRPGAKAHAILLDIDHTHQHWLHPRHAKFYTSAGLSLLRETSLHTNGIFAMWADGEPNSDFQHLLAEVFGHAKGCRIEFPNPITGTTSASTVYLAGSPAS